MESTLSSPKGLLRLNTSTVAPPSPSSIHSLEYKMPSTAYLNSSQQQRTPPSTYRKPRSPPLSPTKRKPPPIPAPSSPIITGPGGLAIPSPAATTTTSTSPTLSMGQLRTPRRQYSDDRFDTVSSSGGSLASTGSPHTSYSGRTFGYSTGYEQQQQHQQRSPSPPLILSSLSLSHNTSPRLEAVEGTSPTLLPASMSSFGGRRGQSKDLKRISTNSLSSSSAAAASASPRRTTTPSLDSPVRDPYRCRGVTGLSAKGVKNEYLAHAQAQAQAQQTQAQAQSPPTRPYNPSNDPYLSNPYQYQSPTLSAAHAVGGGPGSDGGYSSSPQLQYNQAGGGGYHSHQNSPHLEPMEYRQDPYRSAYAQQQHQQQHLGSFSPYQGSMAVPFEDMNQGTHHSRLSLASSSVSGASQRYPMHVLQGHGSTHALTASYQQNRHHAGSIGPGSSASEYGGRSEQDIAEGTRQQASSAGANKQLSKEDAGTTGQRAKSDNDDEQDENTEILARNSQSGGDRTASATTVSRSSSQKKGSKKNKRHQKGFLEESDEEEGQERGENRYREKKRCFCCSRRLCVYMTFLSLICLGVALFFLIPRSPGFEFESVSSMGAPVITKSEFHENWGLQLQVDSSENYVPLKINSLEMTVWLKIDSRKIGHNDGLPSSYTIKPKTIQVISVPMVFDYTSYQIDTNADGTFQALIAACQPVNPTDISLTIGGKINFWGLSWIWQPQFGLNVGNINCPVNAKDPSATPPPPPVVQPPPPASSGTPAPTNGTIASGTPRAGGSATPTSGAPATATGATPPAPTGSRA